MQNEKRWCSGEMAVWRKKKFLAEFWCTIPRREKYLQWQEYLSSSKIPRFFNFSFRNPIFSNPTPSPVIVFIESGGMYVSGFSIFRTFDPKMAILSRNSWLIDNFLNFKFVKDDLKVEFWNLYLRIFSGLEGFSPQLSYFLAFVAFLIDYLVIKK